MTISALTEKKTIVSCPKKHVKLAVRRNRIKRIVKEHIRLSSLKNSQLFIRIIKDPFENDSIELRKDVDKFIGLYENV